MTPGELNKLTKIVADLLARDSNTELTAEEVASEVTSAIVEAYEEIQAKNYNLIVLGHFTPGDGSHHVAAVGPLSTRAVQRARGIGERFAWDYKTRKGTGRFVLVPLVRNPNEAWDTARLGELGEFEKHLESVSGSDDEPTYEAMRFDIPALRRSEIVATWQQDPDILSKKYAPGCTCGLSERYITGNKGYSKHGVPTMECPRHPEGRDGE